MREIAIFCRAFAASRHKVYALCQQLYGEDSIDVYRMEGKLSDPEILDTNKEHIWTQPEQAVKGLLEHKVIHAFCDSCDILFPLLKTGRKFVVHQPDVMSMRGAVDIGEASLHMSDKTVSVFPSKGCQEYMCDRLRIPLEETYVFKALPVLAWQPELPKPEEKIHNSIVYAGFVTTDPGVPNGFRYFVDVFRKFLDAGIHVYLMNAGEAVFPEVMETYKGPGMENLHMMIGKPYRELYQELAKYSVGFVGFTRPPELPDTVKDYGDKSLPNKAFDYMFAGIPSVGHNMAEANEYVKNWGAVTDDPDKLVDAYCEATKMKIDYKKWRQEYCAETQKDMLKEIHDKVRE